VENKTNLFVFYPEAKLILDHRSKIIKNVEGHKRDGSICALVKILQDVQNFLGIGIRNHGRPWACEEATEKVPRIA